MASLSATARNLILSCFTTEIHKSICTPKYILTTFYYYVNTGASNNNNNNNNNWISIAPYGRNFRGAGGRSDQCSVKAWLNRKVLCLDLKTARESLMRTVCSSEFQTVSAEDRKARLDKSVVMDGLSSSGMAAECKVWLQAHSAIWRSR